MLAFEGAKDVANPNRWFVCRLCTFPQPIRGVETFVNHKNTKHARPTGSTGNEIKQDGNHKDSRLKLTPSIPVTEFRITGKPGSYVCPFCGQKASQKSNLKTHIMMKHTKQPRFHCDICKYVTYFQSQLNVHKRIHTGERPFKCEFCEQSFGTTVVLMSHKKTHHGGGQIFRCEFCERTFKRRDYLTTHRRLHTNEKPYECDVCHKAFAQTAALRVHKRNHTGETPYECKVCGKRFKQSTHMLRHLQQHTGKRPYKCSLCSHSCGDKFTLKLHIKVNHEGGRERRFKCDICAKAFQTKANLITHMRMHTKEKVCKCQYCGKEFSYEPSLKKHLRQHTGERPYPCPQCPSKFQGSGDRSAHVKRCHPAEPDPKKCTVCFKRFDTIEILQLHIKGAHNGRKPYSCEVCGESFKVECQRQKHMRKHKRYSERPFQCKSCDSKFWKESDLKIHARTHTGERPFKCQKCPKAFAQKGKMVAHIRRLH